jgi:hypothetical protein
MEPQIKIATWNTDRPTRLAERVPAINDRLKALAPDIVVLTETCDVITPGEEYSVTSSLPLQRGQDGFLYKKGELRVSICTVFPVLETLPVSNPASTACVLLDTPQGKLAVYGGIIGVRGRGEGFYADLKQQAGDLARLGKMHPLCYAGDFNVSFCDNYFPNAKGKAQLEQSFAQRGLNHLTANVFENVDHIALSTLFLPATGAELTCWNENKKLSNHKGVMATLRY